MAGSRNREIPWCTIILVIGALACHSLVLLGNLNTAAIFDKLGHSTTGWSHVGQNLGHSLSNELDVVMGNVTSKLTDAIGQMVMLKSNIDQAVSIIGSSTDVTLSQVKEKSATIAFQSLVVAASSKPGWPGPLARQPALLQGSALAKGDAPLKTAAAPFPYASGVETENEVMWMMETSRINPARHASSGEGPKNSSLLMRSNQDDKDSSHILEWCKENSVDAKSAVNAFLKEHPEEAKKTLQGSQRERNRVGCKENRRDHHTTYEGGRSENR